METFNLRELPTTNTRTNDDIHTTITLDPLIQTFLSTRPLQRLRALKQLGLAEYVYINAKHDRFEHSLGVAHLAERLARKIKDKQKSLKITEKDIMCVKLAGLCHDLGHGPFSHVYDGTFRSQINNNVDWTHEDGSVMMIDAVLNDLGLQPRMEKFNAAVNEKVLTSKSHPLTVAAGEEIDLPLRQISDGYNAATFGVLDRKGLTVSPKNVLTTRDIIFIKEMITCEPFAREVGFMGRHLDKEFLYDIVSNRHSGLDVDKMDYFARDSVRAKGSGQIDNIILEEAFVAKGRCSQPDKCFQCSRLVQGQGGGNSNARTKPNLHYMICWPEKLAVKAMEFFKFRFSMHSQVYTHKTVKAVEFMVCDILTLADPHIKIPTKDPNVFKRISTAMENPDSYVLLKDSILDVIEISVDPKLFPAQQLLKRLRSRDLYKCCVMHSDNDMNEDSALKSLWDKNTTSSFIISLVVQASKRIISEQSTIDNPNPHTVALSPDEIIVERSKIHHGQKDMNPVNMMRFLPKDTLTKLDVAANLLPTATKLSESVYMAHIPRLFQEKLFRLFVKDHERGTLALVSFEEVLKDLQKKHFEAEQLQSVNVNGGSSRQSSPAAPQIRPRNNYLGSSNNLNGMDGDDDDDDDDDSNSQNSRKNSIVCLSPAPKKNLCSLSQQSASEDESDYSSSNNNGNHKKNKTKGKRNMLSTIKANGGPVKSTNYSSTN